MYSVITLQGAGGWMPNLNTRKVPTSTSATWKSLERKRPMRLSLRRRGPVTLEGEEEGDQVEILACGEGLAERGRHDAGRVAGHRPQGGGGGGGGGGAAGRGGGRRAPPPEAAHTEEATTGKPPPPPRQRPDLGAVEPDGGPIR